MRLGSPRIGPHRGLSGGWLLSWYVSAQEELSRNAFLHVKGTEVSTPLKNGRAAVVWTVTLPTKAPGTQVWEEKENIPNMSFGEAAPDHKWPNSSQDSGCGFSPPTRGAGGEWLAPGLWAQTCSPQSAPGPEPWGQAHPDPSTSGKPSSQQRGRGPGDAAAPLTPAP